MRDQGEGIEPAPNTELDHRFVQPFSTPPAAKSWRQAANLGRDQCDPVVVKLLAQHQCGCRTLIEASRDHCPVDSGDPDCLVKRGVGARQFDHAVRAASCCQFPNGNTEITGSGG